MFTRKREKLILHFWHAIIEHGCIIRIIEINCLYFDDNKITHVPRDARRKKDILI